MPSSLRLALLKDGDDVNERFYVKWGSRNAFGLAALFSLLAK